jgi:cytochrome P450
MPRHDPVPLEDVDLADIDGFADLRGFAQLDTLRAEDPVHWNPEPAPNHGFWAVTRYDDIWTVDKDPETFTSTKFVNIEEVDDDLMDLRRSMLETDGTRHQALRRLVQREFTPRNLMKNYEAFLRELTRNTVDEAFREAADNGGEIDFVQKISADFPIQVLARLLDVPREDTAQLIAWGNELVANTDPDYAKVRADLAESDAYKHLPFRSPTVQEVWDYGNDLKAKREGGDGTDLVSILANKMPDDGIPLTQRDFNQYFSLLVIAGNETTRHAISNSMVGLIEQKDQMRALQEDPALIAPAVEELLRWASPVYHFRRTATRDVELGGKQVREGDKVVMWFASGNRDEGVFENPYTIDVRRQNVDHMTFGKGSPHLCLGNNLARMEIRLMFEELLPRLADIEFAGDVRRVRSNFVNGIKKFPVALTPSAG